MTLNKTAQCALLSFAQAAHLLLVFVRLEGVFRREGRFHGVSRSVHRVLFFKKRRLNKNKYRS
jgi:hypothetical protein